MHLSLFSRIYLTVLLTLVLTTAGVILVLDQVNRHRFAGFAQERTDSLQALVALNWELTLDDRLTDWLAILSRLTGTSWQLSQAGEPSISSQWWSEQAEVVLPLGGESGQLIQARISNWDELLTGTGYLMINALSLVPASERDQRLAELVDITGLPAQPVHTDGEPLGFLQRRQLEQGQAVIRTAGSPLVQSQRSLYIPMGQGNALKLGPVVQFAWLTPFGFMLLIALILPAIGGMIYLSLTPIKRRMGRMTRAVDAIQDTPGQVAVPEKPADELGKMGHHINRMAASLVDFGRRNKELNQAVSHDLKTPLAQLKFALELLKPSDQQAFMVGRMHQSIADMESLIDELLLYHSLSNDTSSTNDDTTDLARMLSDLVDNLETPSGMSLDTEIPQSPGWVRGEARLLRRLLSNLVGNALKYGRNKVKISLTSRDDDCFRLLVEDDGPGVPEAAREHVFEPFYRLDKSRESGVRGHGLGLSISRDITRLLGGSLSLGDAEAGGCRVTLLLPGNSLTQPDK